MPAVVRRYPNLAVAIVVLTLAALLPFALGSTDTIIYNGILACAYVMMALGLNIVVGFAGLLDLGYVAFYAFGAYTVGWFASDFFTPIATTGVHIGAGTFASSLPGFHLNFLLLILIAMAICALVGIVIGLPTLRLRGDYIAIVTLAFGEIIYRFASNGDSINPSKVLHAITFGLIDETKGLKLTLGRQSISPTDQIALPGIPEFNSAINLRPYFWLALVLVAAVLFINFRPRDLRRRRARVGLPGGGGPAPRVG